MEVGTSVTGPLGPFSMTDAEDVVEGEGEGLLLSVGTLLSLESPSSVETSGTLLTDSGSLAIVCFGVSGVGAGVGVGVGVSEALSLGLVVESLSPPGESSSVWA